MHLPHGFPVGKNAPSSRCAFVGFPDGLAHQAENLYLIIVCAPIINGKLNRVATVGKVIFKLGTLLS